MFLADASVQSISVRASFRMMCLPFYFGILSRTFTHFPNAQYVTRVVCVCGVYDIKFDSHPSLRNLLSSRRPYRSFISYLADAKSSFEVLLGLPCRFRSVHCNTFFTHLIYFFLCAQSYYGRLFASIESINGVRKYNWSLIISFHMPLRNVKPFWILIQSFNLTISHCFSRLLHHKFLYFSQ